MTTNPTPAKHSYSIQNDTKKGRNTPQGAEQSEPTLQKIHCAFSMFHSDTRTDMSTPNTSPNGDHHEDSTGQTYDDTHRQHPVLEVETNCETDNESDSIQEPKHYTWQDYHLNESWASWFELP